MNSMVDMHRLQRLEAQVGRMSLLLEDWHEQQIRKESCSSIPGLAKEMFVSTILGGVLGYFMFRVLDLHFGHVFTKMK